MNLLVTGANGLLGSNLISEAAKQNLEVSGTYHSKKPEADIQLKELDIRYQDEFRSIVNQINPTHVVNCAAFTDVDECEHHPETAYETNALAPRKLAEICSINSIEFCHISTDYVFDGSASKPYTESAATNPIQTYGKSKLDGEQNINRAIDSPLITRLSFVYGIHRSSNSLQGFPSWILDNLSRQEPLPLFTDQYVTPTRAGYAAKVILELIQGSVVGTVHVACRTCTSPFDIGKSIVSRMSTQHDPITRSSKRDVDLPAQRPDNSCLETKKLEGLVGQKPPSLEEDLTAIEDWLE